MPLLISLVVALGGLASRLAGLQGCQGWSADPLEKPLGSLYPFLKNKWYFDEFYAFFVVKPMVWVSEVFTSQWMDQTVIDGILHSVARLAFLLALRPAQLL